MTSDSEPRHFSLLSILRGAGNEIPSDTVVYFRIVFGLTATCWVAKQFWTGAIQAFYIAPRHHFHFDGFAWVSPLPKHFTHLEFGLLGLAAISIALGLRYRLATVVFALGFTHLFLVDKCLYQNHYYLMCLLAWIMVVIPANGQFAIDSYRNPTIRCDHVPRWSVWLLRFQLGLPYFYGGIAKLNSDWLAGEPIRSMLAKHSDAAVIGPYVTAPWCVAIFVYGGLLFDLLFVPAILNSRSRVLACIFALAFHLSNATLFSIGVFPWLMLFALPIYFEPGALSNVFAGSQCRSPGEIASTSRSSKPMSAFYFSVTAYVIWQVLVPLRHFAIPGETSWTEEGHFYSWRMLVRGKSPALRLVASEPKSRRSGTIDLRRYVTQHQLHRVGRDPRAIHELVGYVANDLERQGFDRVEIRVLSLVSLNGRKPQNLIDPRIDLVRAPIGWGPPAWIVPLTEPLPATPWDLPLSEWESALGIQDALSDSSGGR